MTFHSDRKTVQLTAESRRLWDDVRVWMMNCLAVEAAWPSQSVAEKEQARRGRDQILAAIIQAW